MRLAVFTNQFPGRVNTFFSRDLRALLEAEVEVDVFPIYPLEPKLWRYVPSILDENILPRSKVHHLGLAQTFAYVKPWPIDKVGTFLWDTVAVSGSAARFGLRPIAKSMYVFLKAWAWAQQYSGEYDHILAYWGNYSATCAYIFHRLTGRSIPFSMFLHAGTDLYRDQMYLQKKMLYADNIIVVCEFNKKFINDHYANIFHLIEDKIHVHHLGLDFAEFPYEPHCRSPRRILAVGNLSKVKGFDYMLRAAYDLHCQGIEIEVELIGDGQEAKFLRALVDDLQLSQKVTFRGWLPFNEVQAAMKEATILVHPSIGLGDAVPTVIKESMALGTPVIASNVAGIPELLDYGRCGVLIPPKDVKACARAIEALLGNDTLRLKYADEARKYAKEKFDLWRNGQCLAELLRSTTRLRRTKEPC